MRGWVALVCPALLMTSMGCELTTEVSKAPFELTSGVVSSTTPGATGLSGHAQVRRRLEAFVASSHDDVRTDIARGNGEYLGSVAALAGVPASSQEAFVAEMQRQYAVIYQRSGSTDDASMRVVNTAWSAGYGRNTRQQ
jgi:Protein of unknown function (DUF3015)